MAQQTDDAVKQVANVSLKIREALRSSLPTPMEQLLTIMVPGKVIDPSDYSDDIDEKTGAVAVHDPNALQSLRVQLNSARLCDDMPALSTVQLGPTGRSVARSYAATLTKLVPTGAVVGISDNYEDGKLSAEQATYAKSMKWLTSIDPDSPGKTRVQMYVEKQRIYTQTVESKVAAFSDSLKRSRDKALYPLAKEQREAYDTWVNEHARTYRNQMQAAYMDWVITGKKEEVEHHFALVDVDSAMARVEASKECMRASTIMDSDGSGEYFTVHLEPSNWASLAQKKKKKKKPTGRTAEWYQWEISRLEKLNSVLIAAKNAPDMFEVANINLSNDSEGKGETAPESEAGTTAGDGVTSQAGIYAKAKADYRKACENKSIEQQERERLRGELDTARRDLKEAMDAKDKSDIGRAISMSKVAQGKNFDALRNRVGDEIKQNDETIKNYRAKMDDMIGARGSDVKELISQEMYVPTAMPDPEAVKSTDDEGNDEWTSIFVEVSSKSEKTHANQEASKTTAEVSVAYKPLFGANASFNASYSKTETSASASAEMTSCDIKISFDALRVDIQRNWLRNELFYDSDLTCTKEISPGPVDLVNLIDPANGDHKAQESTPDKRDERLALYSQFPMFPTAFILAANVTLEISGATSSIQSHFRTASLNAGGAGEIKYGPFSINASASYSKNESSNDTKCESTASGCRIVMKAPQIIGWVSQILPPLPRTETKKQFII